MVWAKMLKKRKSRNRGKKQSKILIRSKMRSHMLMIHLQMKKKNHWKRKIQLRHCSITRARKGKKKTKKMMKKIFRAFTTTAKNLSLRKLKIKIFLVTWMD